jgi:2-oxoglutarate dehydrogenase E1 component
METLNMSQARGYRTGGTVHLVVNNQIGFTMSNPVDARSSVYCTEVAKMVQAPIFHVNGDDPEAVIFVTRLALDFRTRFARDVVVDVVSYRRHGHNEADEPAVTQPIMYRKIRQMPTVMELYTRKLVSEGVATPYAVEEYKERYRVSLEDQGVVAENFVDDVSNEFSVDWSPYWGTDWTTHAKTAVGKRQLRPLAEKLNQVPKGFELHPRVKRILDDRKKMAAGAMAADWGFAETMAYATLLVEGHGVRLTGQDSGRGTFFHRHAVLHNQKNGDTHVPLRHLGSSQADFTVIDSLLSEEAALGFEYGYATAEPTTLVVWEAQFGDFANGAQVMVDQFITSGQEKWNRLCHLVMMLPHGYEGAGPEHSSARLERYLQLSAGHNIQVCVPTTPAQMFHLLRRQVVRPFRRPLVIMSPKSLLRFKPSMSSLDQLARGRFYNAIGETADLDPERVRRIVLCSGKVFYDLDAERAARGLEDVALVRIEQLYPFPKKAVLRAMAPFINATRVVWCQEEPRNQGAWYQSQHHLRGILRPGQTLGVSSRPLSASPASGYYRVHVAMQKSLVWNALGIKQGLSVVPRADGELKQA